MEKISQLEKEKLDVQKKMSNESFERSNVNNKSNLRGSKILTRREETDLDSKTINITDLIEENESLKAKYNYIQYLKNKLRLSKKENIQLSSDINDKNTEVFQLSKIFTEGMHEISKELLKVHEMQLDKATSSKIYLTLR